MALLMMWRWATHLDGAPVVDDGPLLDDDAHMIVGYWTMPLLLLLKPLAHYEEDLEAHV